MTALRFASAFFLALAVLGGLSGQSEILIATALVCAVINGAALQIVRAIEGDWE